MNYCLKFCFVALVFAGLVGCSSTPQAPQTKAIAASPDFGYYDLDGSLIKIAVYDTLVSVRIDPSIVGFDPDSFAVHHSCLKGTALSDLDGRGFHTYIIADGYSLSFVMQHLRQEPSVFMVNPVEHNCFDERSAFDNSLIVTYKKSTASSLIDSLQSLFGLVTREILTGNDADGATHFIDFNERTDMDITAIAREYYKTGFCAVVEPNSTYVGRANKRRL